MKEWNGEEREKKEDIAQLTIQIECVFVLPVPIASAKANIDSVWYWTV